MVEVRFSGELMVGKLTDAEITAANTDWNKYFFLEFEFLKIKFLNFSSGGKKE
jgi:hypothetical protein